MPLNFSTFTYELFTWNHHTRLIPGKITYMLEKVHPKWMLNNLLHHNNYKFAHLYSLARSKLNNKHRKRKLGKNIKIYVKKKSNIGNNNYGYQHAFYLHWWRRLKRHETTRFYVIHIISWVLERCLNNLMCNNDDDVRLCEEERFLSTSQPPPGWYDKRHFQCQLFTLIA